MLVNVATCTVLSANQQANVYPTDGDSIGIPMFATMTGSTYALPFLLGITLIPRLPWKRRPRWYGAVAFATAAAGLLVSYSASAVLGLAGLAYWATPHHYVIAASYLCFLLLVGTL